MPRKEIGYFEMVTVGAKVISLSFVLRTPYCDILFLRY